VWLGAFSNPSGFLASALQSFGKQMNVAVDTLHWEFSVLFVDDDNSIVMPPDGIVINGLTLENAR
jgi:hypothetical protein